MYREGGKLKDVVDWLSRQAHVKVEHRKCGSEVLEDSIVQAVERELELHADLVKKGKKTLTIMVQPHLLYKVQTSISDIPPTCLHLGPSNHLSFLRYCTQPFPSPP
jgi:hypothetical protein